MTPVQTVVDTLRALLFGTSVQFENLTMIPVLAEQDLPPDYLTLDEALALGFAEITEISDHGHVPELKIIVKGQGPVLLVEGEELVGAKQNRVLNLTILASAQQTTVIPVSCVEAGRWHRQSAHFAAAGWAQFAEARAAKVSQVTSSLKTGGERTSDQMAVWDLIADKSARLEAKSETSAMSALYQAMETPLEGFVEACTPVDLQRGALFLIDGNPVGLDAFDSTATWRKLSSKLVRSYALDAIDRKQNPRRRARRMTLDAFLEAARASTADAFPTGGEGYDVRLSGRSVAGAALVACERTVHLSVFPVTTE